MSSSRSDRDSYLIIQVMCCEDYPDELNLLDVVTRPPCSNLNLHHKKSAVASSWLFCAHLVDCGPTVQICNNLHNIERFLCLVDVE